MAQKRMFDKAIIETDEFAEMPNSTKALYFLLGMYADDEGFVSLKMVTKVHNFTPDDAGILVAKGYIIPFKTGVVVITSWKRNNWLDSRRIKHTEYTQERSQLAINNGKYELLSDCLADVKPVEWRGEENRRVENIPNSFNNKDEIQKAKDSIAEKMRQIR